ncbi:hypothetical protein G7Y89_g14397 [Cudoniella acicularis]|uniref:Uncharacterized protein n=1 Tax=Cudoniella acicularis TaxID=354080 RepID=A0A8H4VVL3_9HELO|nr:hypothetical protein G7Y89_g14397 [Cudoniella acicularis]
METTETPLTTIPDSKPQLFKHLPIEIWLQILPSALAQSSIGTKEPAFLTLLREHDNAYPFDSALEVYKKVNKTVVSMAELRGFKKLHMDRLNEILHLKLIV